MRKILFLLAASALTMQSVYCQGTTQEEYNYLTRGLKIMEETGLDIKKGYRLSTSFTFTSNGYSFIFRDLIREADGSLAGTSVKAYSPNTRTDYYFCIPSDAGNNSGVTFSQQLSSTGSTDAFEHATIAALIEWARSKGK